MQDIILYEDDDILVVNKPATLPTQADKTGDTSLIEILAKHCQTELFLIHRLDRVASGLVVFAKKSSVTADLSAQFKDKNTDKRYYAIVEKRPELDHAHLTHFLLKNSKTNTSKAFLEEKKEAKRAELAYILRGVSDRYFLLDITLFTGRHHQIRAQLATIGCPIKGDVKYGARRSNANRAIHLHAYQLGFMHPVSKEKLLFKCLPDRADNLWRVFEPYINNQNL
jgi:23S rRNA pseudouridine1911/1915/1917 synthase